MMGLVRTSKIGMDSSRYYQDKKYCRGKGTDNDLPNCTQFDVCRTYEICQVDEPFLMFKGRGAGGFPPATTFYQDTVLPKGSILKDFSIACFEKHVAFIEQVNPDGTCLLSDSRYDQNKTLRNERYYRSVDNVRLKVGQYSNLPNNTAIGKFLGCIYIPVNDVRVQRNESVEQVRITERYVNVRNKPNGDIVISGCYAPMGIFNVLSSQKVDDYTWYEIDKGCYVREGDWLTHYEANNYEKLLKENEELKERLRKIKELCEV